MHAGIHGSDPTNKCAVLYTPADVWLNRAYEVHSVLLVELKLNVVLTVPWGFGHLDLSSLLQAWQGQYTYQFIFSSSVKPVVKRCQWFI